MADLIVLAHAVLRVKSGSVRVYDPDTREAVDVSADDSIDFQFSGTSNHADGITIDIRTSMQNKIDDIAAGLALRSESPREPPIGAAARPFPRSRGKGLDDCARRRQLSKRRESKRFDDPFIVSKPLPLERGKGRAAAPIGGSRGHDADVGTVELGCPPIVKIREWGRRCFCQ